MERASAEASANAVVLVVEDEPVLRASMVRGLSKLPNVEVAGAGTVADAKELIRATRPRMLISDLDLPDGSGVDLINVLDRNELGIPVVFVSGYVSVYRQLIPSRANIEVREKPQRIDLLRNLVTEKLGVAEGTSTAVAGGAAAPFSAADYVQLACMGKHSVKLRFLSEQDSGKELGCVLIRRGNIWSAVFGERRGESALRGLLFDPKLIVQVDAAEDEPAERNCEGSWEGLLLEAARVQDEQNHARSSASSDPPDSAGADEETASEVDSGGASIADEEQIIAGDAEELVSTAEGGDAQGDRAPNEVEQQTEAPTCQALALVPSSDQEGAETEDDVAGFAGNSGEREADALAAAAHAAQDDTPAFQVWGSLTSSRTMRQRRRWLTVALVAAVALVGVNLWLMFSRRSAKTATAVSTRGQGRLVVSSEVAARVSIDGKSTDSELPLTRQLAVGEHQLKITFVRSNTVVRRKIKILAGQTATLRLVAPEVAPLASDGGSE